MSEENFKQLFKAMAVVIAGILATGLAVLKLSGKVIIQGLQGVKVIVYNEIVCWALFWEMV